MALSKSEIEILIKARNEAQGAFDSLSKQVGAVTGGAVQATAGLEKVGKATKDAGQSSQGASVMFGMLAERLARGLVGAFGDTIREANKLDSGLIGLASVAKAFGNDADAAKQAAKTLAADGLMGVGDAATGLKNLLAAGFGLPEAVTLMNRFKDSAAFGRQGSLDFGEAIRGATEGIKNGNSILVDNAGVTKNLSQMLTEAGFSAQDLSKASTDVNVRMAIFNGIVKETNPQLGDTARYLDTAGGKQAAFNAQIEIAQQKIGKALQPALSSLLEVLSPIIQALGNSTAVLLPLGAAIGAVVIPMAAMTAASAMGIPPLSALTASLAKLWATAAMSPVFGAAAATVSAGSLVISRSSLILDQYGNAAETVGVKAVAAAPKIGLMTKAIGAFVAWEVGQALGGLVVRMQELGTESESTGGKVAAFLLKYTGIGPAATMIQNITEASVTAANGTASLVTQVTAMKQASDLAGRAVLSYAEAVKILEKATNPAEISMRNYWATLTKVPNLNPTAGQIQTLVDSFDRIANAANVSKARIAGWEGELSRVATAGGLKTLRSELDLGVLSTKELAVQFGISEDAIKFYEKGLKNAADATKAHGKAQDDAKKKADDFKKANEALADSLFNLGVVTTATGAKELKKLIDPLTVAGSVSTPAFQQALIKLLPELEDLAKKAAASGVQVTGLAAAMDRSKKAAEDQLAPMLAWENSLPTVAIEDLIAGTHAWTAEEEWAGVQATKTADAFKYFGISTRKELQDTAAAAARHYQAIVAAIGAHTPEAIEAYKRMIDAQKAATLEIPSLWQSEIFPKVKGVIGTLTDAINGSFAQMLLGAKGFKDGFVDIWNSIKAAIGNILNSILSAFLNTFLKGMVGAMSGQRGAMSSAFASMFNGGGTGGGINMSGLFGGGTSAGGGAAAGVQGAGSIGGGAAGSGAVGGASGTMAWMGGAAAAGSAGWALGNWGESLFGGAGAKAGAFGAGTGAAAGAAIGSILPGIGTAAGAIVGGIAGLLSGVIGTSVGEKVNDIRDQFFANFGSSGTGAGSGFGNVAAQLAQLSEAEGGGAGGGKLFKDLIGAKNMKDLEAAVMAATNAVTKFQAAEKSAADQAAATAAAEEEAAQKLAARQTAIRTEYEKTKTVIQGQIDDLTQDMMGLQNSIANEAPEEVMGVIEAQTRTQIDELSKQKDALDAHLAELTQQEQDALAEVSASAVATAEEAKTGIEDVFDGFHVDIDFRYRIPDDWPFPGREAPDVQVPGAAGGVMSRQPGLVVFGEGGETELGGPRSFFRDVFESLGLGQGSAGGQAQAPITIGPFNITAMSSSDLKGAVEKDLIPPILDALRVNRRGSLTDMKTILGVS